MLRKIKRKYGISAPRLAVRPHVPWYVRWAIILPFVLAAGGLVWWAYGSGIAFAGFHHGQTKHELPELRAQVSSLRDENTQLASQAASFERQAQIERAANLETAKQLQGVSEENLRLKEDLTLFQNLTLSGTREGELSLQHFRVKRDTLPGEYRYRLLLVQGGQQRTKPFQGNLQLLVNVLHNGKRSVMLFPQKNTTPVNTLGYAGEDATYQLNFKYYQRIERSFQLPPRMSVESVQVRIFEQGLDEPKIKQSVNLS